ncbi:MAG TPA: 5-oxoprolinase subunit PxpA [Acidimicrobiales bacterium]|nr:5-oxoprolinase subunit PxpA [Acidimicrobiales bacterium]
MPVIDLNADVGEEAGGADGDTALLDVVTSASVACGFHAGDPSVMRRTLGEAVARHVVVGAHPSYPDRPGFGRRDMAISPARLTDDLLYQIGALDGLARSYSARVRYVKPHGALYLRMADDDACARAVCDALRAYGDLALLAPYGSRSIAVAEQLGVQVATEAFADRAYLPNGQLARRAEPGALVTDPDEVAARAVTLAVDHRVAATDGSWVPVAASSICIHGDSPGSAALAQRVRTALTDAGIGLEPFVR